MMKWLVQALLGIAICAVTAYGYLSIGPIFSGNSLGTANLLMASPIRNVLVITLIEIEVDVRFGGIAEPPTLIHQEGIHHGEKKKYSHRREVER
jgi:hypothetical protein